MKYVDFYNSFKNKLIFSTNDIRKYNPAFHKARLTEWKRRGYIQNICRGWYAFSDLKRNRYITYFIANKIYDPSYISLESALSYYNLIPERVYAVTSVCTRKAYTFQAPFGRFSYRQISPSLNWGYNLLEENSVTIKIASIEKTVLDYLYFHKEIAEPAAFHEWRFNREEFLERADLHKMRKFAENYKKKWFMESFEKLLKLIKEGSKIRVKI